MTFDEAYERLPGNGWLTRAEAELLWNVAAATTGPILEVGSYEGRSTVLLALTGRPVYAVDSFDDFAEGRTGEEIYRALMGNLDSRGLGNVTVYRQRIQVWRPQPVGMAYLDGPHDYQGTVDQIKRAWMCGAGVIAIHDVNDAGQGLEVKRAALGFLGPWAERVERLAVWELPR